jgi:hypothetical protein
VLFGNGRAAGATAMVGRSDGVAQPTRDIIRIINRHRRDRGSQPRLPVGGPGHGLAVKIIGVAGTFSFANRGRRTRRHDGTVRLHVTNKPRRLGTDCGRALLSVHGSAKPTRVASTTDFRGATRALPSHANALYAKGRMA